MVKKATAVFLFAIILLPYTLKAVEANFHFTRVCVGYPTMLYNTSTPPDSIFRVLWDLNGDGKFGDAQSDTVVMIFPFAGAHYVGIKVISYSGDMDAIYKMVTVSSLEVEFTLDYSCANLPVYFYDKSLVIEDTVFQYLWDFDDGTPVSFLQNPTHVYAGSGEFEVTLTLITFNGCIDSVKHVVIIQEPPFVDVSFSGDTVFPAGDSVIATIIGSYDSVFWSTGEQTLSIVIKESGYYFVQGYRLGCLGERFFTVEAVEDKTVRVMNLFTPNGDGFNDTWEIINIAEIGPCQVDIYNRWGEKVFSAPQYNNDWDGTFKGKVLSTDTYYYLMRCSDDILQKGTVNILR